MSATASPTRRGQMTRSDPGGRVRGVADAAAALVVYAGLAALMTWPLLRGVLHDVPSDLGDPLLNAWILAWDADHLARFFSGHFGALRGYWNANIFFPHPLTLAYSEHLTAEAVEILPFYAATRNPILCYNLVFLSTFALSGLGAYLLVRQLTGSRAAAFVGGIAYGFAPYRFGILSHVQVMSSAWMPFTLYALDRYFESRRRRALAGAALAFVVQALSCGYYLIYFSPVLLIFAAWKMSVISAWRDRRVWRDLLIASALVVVALMPFLVPYVIVRRLGIAARSLTETDRFSADVYAYLTAGVTLRVWGSVLRAWPKSEGSLFPGLTIAALAMAAAVVSWRRCRSVSIEPRYVRAVASSIVAATAVVLLIVLFGSIRVSLGPIAIKATSLVRVLTVLAMLSAALLVLSPAARRTGTHWLGTPAAVMSLIALFAIVMSFGPQTHSRGRIVADPSLYALFFYGVPGFDGLRVPARFAMIVALALAALAGMAVAMIRSERRTAGAIVASALMIGESWAVPIPINGTNTEYQHAGFAPLPASVATVPPIYDAVAKIPRDAVLIELPLGEPDFDTRAMFYSTRHWRRLVNGYSGNAPIAYDVLTEAINDVFRSAERAWAAVTTSQATHLLIHEGSYAGARGQAVDAWARSHGAREIAADGTDHLFVLPQGSPAAGNSF
jgi:hypothetical protein